MTLNQLKFNWRATAVSVKPAPFDSFHDIKIQSTLQEFDIEKTGS